LGHEVWEKENQKITNGELKGKGRLLVLGLLPGERFRFIALGFL